MAFASRTPELSLSLTPSLHPHLLIRATPPAAECTLHLTLTIPDGLFPDPDELADTWGKPGLSPELKRAKDVTEGGSESTRVRGWFLDPRDIDIERPVLSSAGVQLSLALVPPKSGEKALELEGDVPLHARYFPPSEEDGWDVPILGGEGGEVRAAWVCGDDVVPRWAELPEVKVEPLSLHLPAARASTQVPVDIVTAVIVWAGWAWLAYKVWSVVRTHDRLQPKRKTQ